MNYDVIGDLHGDSVRLHALLRRLGYREDAAGFAAPVGHQAVFLGDLIDRGPGQLEVLDVVRRLVDRGDAHCVMGNHELNAIGWVTPREEGGGFLRDHTAHRRDQHAVFLRAVGEGSARHLEWIDWFRTLPVALDLGGIRAVHAWWQDGHVATAAAAGPRPLAGARLHEALDRRTTLGAAIDGLTKGHELALPEGATFVDKEGHARREVRTQWWRDGSRTYREAAIVEDAQRHAIPDVSLPDHYRATPVRGAPVFVGHYWLSGEVKRRDPKVACLDFSGAKGGPLVAYRWRGEPELRDEAFLQVAAA